MSAVDSILSCANDAICQSVVQVGCMNIKLGSSRSIFLLSHFNSCYAHQESYPEVHIQRTKLKILCEAYRCFLELILPCFPASSDRDQFEEGGGFSRSQCPPADKLSVISCIKHTSLFNLKVIEICSFKVQMLRSYRQGRHS